MDKPSSPAKLLAMVVPAVGIILVLIFFRDRGQPPAPKTPEKTGGPPVPVAKTPRASAEGQLPAEEVRKLSNIETRAATVRRMGETKDSRASTFLRPYCSDADVTVRLNSIWALGEIGDTRAGLEISTRTADPDPRVRMEVTIALAKLVSETDPAEAVISGLMECLKSEDVKTKLEAARGLAKCKDDQGIKVLVNMLGHQDPAVRKGAEEGLRGVGDSMIPALTRALAQPRADEDTLRNVRLLAIFKRKESLPTLVRVLDAVCPEASDRGRPPAKVPVREACVEALIALGPEIVPDLNEQLVKARCGLGLKTAGAEVLKTFGQPAVEPICQRIITRQIFPEELELKLWVDTLGEIGDPAAAAALSSALTKPVKDVEFYKKAVAEAVRKIEAKTGRKLELPPPPAPPGK